MATLSQEDRRRISDSLSELTRRLEKLRDTAAANGGSLPAAPSGRVAGASTDVPSGLNAAQLGGASGVGFEDEETQGIIADQVNATIQSGGSKSQVGDTISSSQAVGLARSFGLEGLVDSSQFAGLTRGEAASRARAEQQKRTQQVSANTSFAFNPETLQRTQRQVDKFGFALDELENDPFEPKEFKDEERQNTIEIASRELGKLFDTPEQLYDAANFNEPMKNALQGFIDKGGSLESIAKNITAPSAVTGNENPASYLSNISNPAAMQEAEEMAIDEMMPESEIAQAEIARLGRIPEDLKSLYFGTEKEIGIYQMRQQQSAEEIRIIEEKERDAKSTARDRADLSIDKNKAEAKRQKNQVEENRARAKNYMTARLAKLGALKTTGAAPLAIKTLDAKYDQTVSQIDQAYTFANRNIEISLTEDLNNIENTADSTILKIQEDLTLGAEKMAQEVLKAQQSADKEIYNITEQYARRLRTRTTQYTSDLKKEAEAYAKKYAAAASGGQDKALFTNLGTVTKDNNMIPEYETQLESSRGDDGFVNSALYNQLASEWIEAGGTISSFKKRFPVNNYVNPEDFSLRPELQSGKQDSGDDEPFVLFPEN
jgi:hypothetical protein